MEALRCFFTFHEKIILKSCTANRFFLLSLCLFVIIPANCCFGQDKQIDSLVNILKTSKEDTNKVNILLKLAACEIDNGNFDLALSYTKSFNSLSQRINYSKGVIKSYSYMGEISYYKGDYDQALKNYFLSLKSIKNPDDVEAIAIAYNNIGLVYDDLCNYPEALKYYFMSLKLEESRNNKTGIAMSYNNIGNVFYSQKNYSKAFENYSAALKLMKAANNKKGMAIAYASIAMWNFDQSRYDEALTYHFLALKIEQELNNKIELANTYNNVGNIYYKKGYFTEALKNHLAAYRIRKETGEKQALAFSLLNLGSTYDELDSTALAGKYWTEALNLAKEIGDKETIKNSSYLLSCFYDYVGKYQLALLHYKTCIVYRDSISNEESNIKSLNIVHQYESEKKEKEIAQLNLDVLTKQKKVEEKNFTIYSIIAGVIMFIVLGAILYNRYQLKQKNAHQNILAKQREENALAVLQAQENERTRIAKDLHDGVGTFLSTLKLNVLTLENALNTEKSSYNNTLDLIDKTSIELRNVMNNLSDETLQQEGLTAALNQLVERVNKSGITQISFQYHGFEKRLNTITEINLYRASQELIQNCLKHSCAKQATLQLIEHDASIVLTMEDNGVGFNPNSNEQSYKNGMGLSNIRKRIAFIKGSVQIDSAPQKGTTWVIEVPKQFI